MKTFLLSLSVAALSATGALADEIRVLNWQGYGTDQDFATKPFEEATGHTVVHEYFNSEQEMLTKLRTNPGAYDVVMINATFTEQAAAEGLIAPIDTAALPNFDGIPAKFADDPMQKIDGAQYGVPWTWGLTSFAINAQSVDEAPSSIEALWDPKYEGHVSIRDDAIEAMQIGALATGQDINDIKDIEAVKDKLAALLPNLLTFWGSENDWNQSMASGQLDIATYWSGSAVRSIAQGLEIEFVIPEEGAIGWLDALSIPATSEHKAAGEAFINWMIDPEFYVAWDKAGSPAPANAKAAAALPEEAFNRRVLGDPEVLARVQFQVPVEDATKEQYLEIWQTLKARQ
ncbi:extracellular solute-binding protein [Citreicella sp. C3M06]|uniref:ABC transporter substrate-binding protein n=1 Tax=Citreicella sp. C3M06 TaxID=2841564 RepID=UPI001C0A1465|nr:extracellular solute-binding protein [Citreicella sp. C3M06]MBU2961302.1 extracellular solute-binding protein [Citreicella sp. C3M06]